MNIRDDGMGPQGRRIKVFIKPWTLFSPITRKDLYLEFSILCEGFLITHWALKKVSILSKQVYTGDLTIYISRLIYIFAVVPRIFMYFLRNTFSI